MSPAYGEWLKRINALIDHEEQVISQDIGAVREAAGGFRLLILLVTAVAIALSIGVSLQIIRKLKSTLGAEPYEVAQAIQRLADGELMNRRIDTRYPHSAMGALHNMLGRLSEAIAQVRSAAGEHGRGFAVVADEVRSLAARTQDSTREIRGMIGKLQEGASKAAEVMRSSRQLAQQTVEQTGLAENALTKIRTEVTEINDMNAQIASAAEEQSAAAEEVNQNINRTHNATLETSAGSAQVASSSRELATLANRLSDKVRFFKL